MIVVFHFLDLQNNFITFLKKIVLDIFDPPGILIINSSISKRGICSIDNFNLSAVNDYEKCFKNETGKISFPVFTKIIRWKHQTTSPIGDSMESKVFDELLLIQIKITITKLLEKKYVFFLRKVIDRADEHDR